MPTNNAWNSNIPVEISKGGTNATSMATSTGIVKYDGTSLVTSSTALIDSSNRMTNTSQPCFLAWASAATNVTGDGTTYTVIFNNEIYDNNNNFDGTSTFTAPVTGRYLLTAQVLLGGVTSQTSCFLAIVTTNRTYGGNQINPSQVRQADFQMTTFTSCIADMSAGDTAQVKITLDGSTKVVDIGSSGSATDLRTYFCGHLVC